MAFYDTYWFESETAFNTIGTWKCNYLKVQEIQHHRGILLELIWFWSAEAFNAIAASQWHFNHLKAQWISTLILQHIYGTWMIWQCRRFQCCNGIFICNGVGSSVPLGARTSARAVMTKYGSRLKKKSLSFGDSLAVIVTLHSRLINSKWSQMLHSNGAYLDKWSLT